MFFLHEWTDAFQKTPTAKFVSLQKPIFRLREQAYAAYRLRVPRSSFSCLIRTSGVISASVKTLTVAALSLTLGLGLPTGAQVPANASPNTESRPIKNIAPEEMWKRVTQCVFPTYAALAFSAHITGTVDIGLGISPEGDVANYRVLSGHPLLVAPAVDAIRQWKFQPDVVQDEVTWTRVRALVRFNADGTTAVDLARALRADDFGDPGSTSSATETLPRPATAAICPPDKVGGDLVGGDLVGGDLTPPSAMYVPLPHYSKAARKGQLQGEVKLSVVVAADGTVHDVKVVQSLGKGLDEEAIEAVQHWKFIPAMINGRPVNVRISLVVNFALIK